MEKIRVERRKAKANRSKYTGVGNDGQSFGSSGGFSGGSGGFSGGALSGASFQTQQGSRYGGFGSDSLAAGGGGGGGSDPYSRPSSGGGGASGLRDQTSTRPDDFEEYDAGDDEDLGGATRAPARAKVSVAAKGREEQQKSAPPVKAVDLFDFGDDDVVAGASLPPLDLSKPTDHVS